MSDITDRYRGDVNRVIAGLRDRGDHESADQWRRGSDEFLAGRTGCHNWHSAIQQLKSWGEYCGQANS